MKNLLLKPDAFCSPDFTFLYRVVRETFVNDICYL